MVWLGSVCVIEKKYCNWIQADIWTKVDVIGDCRRWCIWRVGKCTGSIIRQSKCNCTVSMIKPG